MAVERKIAVRSAIYCEDNESGFTFANNISRLVEWKQSTNDVINPMMNAIGIVTASILSSNKRLLVMREWT